MEKIIPYLWFDKEALEAVKFYTSIFSNSSINDISYRGEAGKELHWMDAWTVLGVDFKLEGQTFVAFNWGPVFKFTPAISFFVRCETIEEVDNLYNKLSVWWTVLMVLDKYPFSERYAWISDKYGISWQLFLGDTKKQKITPCLMFVGNQAWNAEKAIQMYTSIFPDSKIWDIYRYWANNKPEIEWTVMHAIFSLSGHDFIAMDSNLEHNFTFNEAISLSVDCKDQKEIDYYWEKISAEPESESCWWLKDKFGVSWQIVPSELAKMMKDKDSKKSDRVMEAFLNMKKLDLEKLRKAYNG